LSVEITTQNVKQASQLPGKTANATMLPKRSSPMKRFALAAVLVLISVGPSFAKVHKDVFPMQCSALWPAVRDTLRNSGKYGIVSMDSNEMIATYTMGIGSIGQKRTNSVALNSSADTCEMVITSGFSGLTNDDAGDFKKRVNESLAKLKAAAPPAPAAKPDDASKPQ
jgi:hypothetical protein